MRNIVSRVASFRSMFAFFTLRYHRLKKVVLDVKSRHNLSLNKFPHVAQQVEDFRISYFALTLDWSITFGIISCQSLTLLSGAGGGGRYTFGRSLLSEVLR